MQSRNVRRSRKARPTTLPAPIGGLNKREGLANMPATDAVTLDNWFPNNTTVDTRNGCEVFAYKAVPFGPIESLEVFSAKNTQSLVFATAGSVYYLPAFFFGDPYPTNMTGYVALKTAQTSSKLATCMFSNAGGSVMIVLSGSDQPWSFDGSAATNLTITGLTGSQNNLFVAMAFKGRLFLLQSSTNGFYYLAVGAIQGAASFFDLSQQSRGGRTIGMATFSHDGGNGMQDYCVFMSNMGEYIVYEGTDPANASTWRLAGRYMGPIPIGKKGWFNFRSDLYIISEEGVVSFAEIMANGAVGEDVKYLTSKLGTAYTDLVRYRNTHGWCSVASSIGNKLVVNVPLSDSTSGDYAQFVMNTDSGAWCSFTGWNALCWAQFRTATGADSVSNMRIMFGDKDGHIMLADIGDTDNGAAIVCDAEQAYNYFDDGGGSGAADKHFHFGTYILQSDAVASVQASIGTNFISRDTYDIGSLEGTGEPEVLTAAYNEIGYAGSVRLKTTRGAEPVKWFATRVTSEKSNGIVFV